jgi:WD40 repeat protein
VYASGDDRGTVLIRQRESNDTVARLTGHTGAIFGLAFSADGRRLATASLDGTIRVWGLPK